MQQQGEGFAHPRLKRLVVEASRALARLDADRLEELALSCQTLNSDITRAGVFTAQPVTPLPGAQDRLAQDVIYIDSARAAEQAREPSREDLARSNEAWRADLVAQAREAVGEMAVFARILDATRANLEVMHRLRELRAGRLEYGKPQAPGWGPSESRHGDD